MKKEFEDLRKEHEKLMKKTEKGITKEYKDALTALRELMGETYTKYEMAGELTYIDMAKYNRLAALYKAMDVIVNELYVTTAKRMRAALKEDYLLGHNMVRELVNTHTNKGLIGLVKDDVLQKALTNDISGLKWTDRMGLHRNTAVLKIRETVTLGLKEGSTYAQMSKRLNESLSGQVVQPVRIVRTEGHRVISESKKDSLDVAANKGLRMSKTWMTARDERVRSQHSTMDGAIVLYDEYFIMPDGASGFAPGMIGSAQHDIHCRCDWSIDFID